MKVIWEREDVNPERIFMSKVVHSRNPSDLRYSHYVIDPQTLEVTHKTCTRCSQEQGRFVWYRIEQFGYRIMENNSILPQAQCSPCRGRGRLRLVA
jgi:hypothetical protein